MRCHAAWTNGRAGISHVLLAKRATYLMFLVDEQDQPAPMQHTNNQFTSFGKNGAEGAPPPLRTAKAALDEEQHSSDCQDYCENTHSQNVEMRGQFSRPRAFAAAPLQTKLNWRSALDCDESIRVAAPNARTEREGEHFGKPNHRRCRMIVVCCISAIMLGGVESATICASQSSASELATTSVTSGTPASHVPGFGTRALWYREVRIDPARPPPTRTASWKEAENDAGLVERGTNACIWPCAPCTRCPWATIRLRGGARPSRTSTRSAKRAQPFDAEEGSTARRMDIEEEEKTDQEQGRTSSGVVGRRGQERAEGEYQFQFETHGRKKEERLAQLLEDSSDYGLFRLVLSLFLRSPQPPSSRLSFFPLSLSLFTLSTSFHPHFFFSYHSAPNTQTHIQTNTGI